MAAGIERDGVTVFVRREMVDHEDEGSPEWGGLLSSGGDSGFGFGSEAEFEFETGAAKSKTTG